MRSWWRHEQASVTMALVTAGHHSYRKTTGIKIDVQAGTLLFYDFVMDSDDTNPDVFDVPAPVIDYMTPIPVVKFDETAPATEYVVPAPSSSCAAPTPETEHVAPTSPAVTDIKHVFFASDDTYIAPASPRVNRDFHGLVNPQFSTTSVEVSTSKVVGLLLHSERIEVQIGDIPVPPCVEDTVEVVRSLP